MSLDSDTKDYLDGKFGDVNKRLDAVDTRLGAGDKRMNTIELALTGSMDGKPGLAGRVLALEQRQAADEALRKAEADKRLFWQRFTLTTLALLLLERLKSWLFGH